MSAPSNPCVDTSFSALSRSDSASNAGDVLYLARVFAHPMAPVLEKSTLRSDLNSIKENFLTNLDGTGVNPVLAILLKAEMDNHHLLGIASRKSVKRSQYAVVLVLAPTNGTFERKSLVVPFAPEVLKLGRQTSAKTAASPDNGYFDSRVLSRQHAEIWADRETGRIWLKDCRSSNGTYLNRQRLSGENTESEPFELRRNDQLDLGIDIASEENSSMIYRKISARVERIVMMPLSAISGSDASAAVRMKLGLSGKPYLSNLVWPPRSQPHLLPQSQKSLSFSAPAVSSIPLEDKEPLVLLKALVSGIPNGKSIPTKLSHVSDLDQNASLKTIQFENAAKMLAAETQVVRNDIAKLRSVQNALSELKHASEDNRKAMESATAQEIDRLKQEIASLKQQLVNHVESEPLRPDRERQMRTKTKKISRISFVVGARRGSDKIFKPSDLNNTLFFFSMALIILLAGEFIIFFFNPPYAPELRL